MPCTSTHHTAKPTATITQLQPVTQGETAAQTRERLQTGKSVSVRYCAYLAVGGCFSPLPAALLSPAKVAAFAGGLLLLLLAIPAACRVN